MILDFYTSSCGPCRKIEPIMQELEEENKGVSIVKINTDIDRALPTFFGIRSLPSLLFFKRGEEIPVGMMVGAQPKENFQTKINQLLYA